MLGDHASRPMCGGGSPLYSRAPPSHSARASSPTIAPTSRKSESLKLMPSVTGLLNEVGHQISPVVGSERQLLCTPCTCGEGREAAVAVVVHRDAAAQEGVRRTVGGASCCGARFDVPREKATHRVHAPVPLGDAQPRDRARRGRLARLVVARGQQRGDLGVIQAADEVGDALVERQGGVAEREGVVRWLARACGEGHVVRGHRDGARRGQERDERRRHGDGRETGHWGGTPGT